MDSQNYHDPYGKAIRTSLNDKIIVALDVEGKQQALRLADQLQGSGCWLKVGLELYAAEGPQILGELKERGFKIFLDLKLYDIPNTVERSVRVLTRWGVDMLDVHCSGGFEMMARAVEAAKEEGIKAGLVPKVIGVSVLTSMSEAVLKETGVHRSLVEQVTSLALLSQKAGLDGVVASAREAVELRKACGSQFILVTPGIRPTWSATNDQVRICTPRQAIEAGSSYLVVGRPVTRAENPRLALEQMWE